ncbi:MAG: hypothetical protein KDD44_05895 [Bdellovibrionales bacterium]|nr:hypothetical protein [Bdellovibrionales bacterium]
MHDELGVENVQSSLGYSHKDVCNAMEAGSLRSVDDISGKAVVSGTSQHMDGASGSV